MRNYKARVAQQLIKVFIEPQTYNNEWMSLAEESYLLFKKEASLENIKKLEALEEKLNQ